MVWFAIVMVSGILVACANDKVVKPILAPHSRLIYHNGEQGVYTICDRGNRIYMSERGLVTVIAGGCPDGQP